VPCGSPCQSLTVSCKAGCTGCLLRSYAWRNIVVSIRFRLSAAVGRILFQVPCQSKINIRAPGVRGYSGNMS
jgi:hypothetical protein